MAYRRVFMAAAIAEESPADMRLSDEMKALASLRADLAFSQRQKMKVSAALPESRLVDIKYAVSWIDGHCELTVFENNQACSVVLNRAMVEQLVELLKGQ